MVIPDGRNGRAFWERLPGAVEVSISVGVRSLSLFVEPPKLGWAHACTVDDIEALLGHLPTKDLAAIELVVLRQPKRKEKILSDVWGRWIPPTQIGRHRGEAIVLEAQVPGFAVRWPTSLSPADVRQLERLESEGHSIRADRRNHVITSDFDAIRATQLFRTLPHELGHSIDFHQTADLLATAEPGSEQGRMTAWESKTKLDKEAFAERYANEVLRSARAAGLVPFSRRIDYKRMRQFRLDPTWFGLAAG